MRAGERPTIVFLKKKGAFSLQMGEKWPICAPLGFCKLFSIFGAEKTKLRAVEPAERSQDE